MVKKKKHSRNFAGKMATINEMAVTYRQHITRLYKPTTARDYSKRLDVLLSWCSMHGITRFEDVDFTTFLCYIGGHQHQDICGYIPYTNWSDQLLIFIAAGTSGVKYTSCDDLLWNFNSYTGFGQQYEGSEPSYRINKITLDFEKKEIVIKRIGNKTTALYNTTADSQANPPVERPHGGRVRDEITFPFKKN